MLFSFFAFGKKKNIDVRKVGFFSKGIGLMFRSSSTKSLLFDFYRESRVAITSIFVFFPFLAVWLDENHRVVETKVIRPFTIIVIPKKPCRYLIEIPLHAKNSHYLLFFRRKMRNI